MMRRSRISVKPNFRAGNRTDTGGEQASQRANEAGDALPAVEAEEVTRPAPSQQQTVPLKEPSEGVGIKDTPEMSSQMKQNDGSPSSGAATSSAAPNRRMRISATPKLVRPKLTSTPQTRPSARMPSLAPSPLPNEEHVQIHDSASVSIISNDLPESGTPRKSTSPTNLPTLSSTMTQSSSPCVPSTSGLQKSPESGKKSVEDSPPSPQPGQVPQQPPQEPESPECPFSPDLSSVCIKPSHCDKTGSSEMTENSSDTDRILRALKLKELMKLERRKDIQRGKRRVGHKDYTALDRSKMTMRDLIYYLPNSSPMRSSKICEENQAETIIPPSPKQQIKTAANDEGEEEEEEEEEEENEEMLMPKVRVAEDGSIVLDEESLTVRVQRSSNTKMVESSTALFERGSTTTYSSFRKLNHVKSWSVRETDMFFLAISMVGTDFSMIGQLLTHRSRTAIRNKFKKEERLNSWRVDKALRNKRPYDKEFFSYLLEKVLTKDKDKRKSVKLILPKTSKPRKSKDDHEELEDDGDVSVEKENEDVSNVKEADTSVPAKKRRKRTRDVSKDKDNSNSTEEQVKRKRQRKRRKKTREVHSNDDTEGESDLNVEIDAMNVNKEDELERSTSASKRRRKRSKSDGKEQNEKPIKGTKGKQLKKSLKVVCDHEESVNEHEESSIMDEDDSATKKKKKRAKNSNLDGDEPGKGKKNTKRKKALKKSTVEEEENIEGDTSADLQEAEKLSTPVSAEVADNVLPKTTRRNEKPLPNLATTRRRKTNKQDASVEVERESQDDNNHESILTGAGSPLEDNRLQMKAVVVLEKTPPRQHFLSPTKVQSKNNELEPSMSSPASPSSSESSSIKQTRMQRAGRVKRDLSTSRKMEIRKGIMDQEDTEPKSPMGLLERITQESEDEEEDNSLNENLLDLSCLRGSDSQSFQRMPMVVLSREEVDMVLDASDQSSDDDDPSVSPLDLSLNTELSFPLQCSNILGDIDEEAEADCVLEEHEERTNEMASHEEGNCEELELRESASAQHDISNLRDISTSLKQEVCSQSEVGQSKVTTSCPMEEAEPQVHPMACNDETTVATVLEGSPPRAVLDNLDPIWMKPGAPMTQETVRIETATLGTTLVVSDAVEESEKAILPTLLKESELASSEITAQSKLTQKTGSGLESQRSLQATPEVKGELQMSLQGPSQTLETLRGSSEIKEDTQKSALASPKVMCEVSSEVKEDSQEEMSVQASGASVSSEHGVRPTRRSRFMKPKPNLCQKSRVTVLPNQRQDLKTPSTLKPTISTEKLLYSSTTDQHGALAGFSKEDDTEENETPQSDTMDQMESESTKDLSDASRVVPDQENITTVTPSPASADEPQVASERSSSRCDADMMPPCTSLTLPQPLQTGEDTDTGAGQVIVPSEDVCAPVEILHLTEGGYNDEEPTFILTLYEIPVTQAYLPSSSNDSVMTSDLPTVETPSSLGFSDQPHTLPSSSESSRIDSLPMESSGTEKVYSQKEVSAHATSHEITSPHIKDEDRESSANLEMGIPSLDPDSEFKKGSEFAPLEDLAPRIQCTPFGFSASKCITALPQDLEDTEQCEEVSHMVLDDVFVPVSEETGDDSSKDRTMAGECKVKSKEASSTSVTEDFAEIIKEQTASYEPITLDTKDEESDACVNLETGISHMNPDSECQKGSEIDPLDDLASRTQSTPSGFNSSKCITALPQDLEDTEECEIVSHRVLDDVFVPVSEETGDDTSKDRTVIDSSKEASSASVTEDFAENIKEKTSEHMTSHDVILLDTKDEESDASGNLEVSIPRLDLHSECEKGSEIAPPKDLVSRTQSPAFGFIASKCIQAVPQDSEDTKQCERVSHMVLDGVFVPVSEETGDDSREDSRMAEECKLERKEASSASLPERQDTPYEELAKVEKSLAVSIPLLHCDSMEDTPSFSEEKKAPARRRAKQIKPQPKLVKRAHAKGDASKTDHLVREPSQPTSSHVDSPVSHEENLAGISNTTTKKSVDRMLSIRGNKPSFSRGKEIKPKSIAEESPKMSQGDLEPTGSKPISAALRLSKEPTLEEENVTGDTTAKDDVKSSAEDKELSTLTSSEGANVQPCCEDINLMKTPGSGSTTVDSEETEAETQGVSHMVLPDVFVLVSDETEDDISTNWTESIESSPQRVSLTKKSGAHFQKEFKSEGVSHTLIEESTQNRSSLVDIKTPVRKKGKHEMSLPTSPQATSSPSQLTTPPRDENMVLLEERLQRRHHIMPCTVRLSSLDTAAQSLTASQHGDKKSNYESTVMSSPTCHASVMPLSEESRTPSLFTEMNVENPELEKKSPTRRKGKKNESSPHTTLGHLKPVQTVSQTRQLTITDWAKKKSPQYATHQEEKESVKSSQTQSSLKAKEVSQPMSKTACSKSQHTDSEEPEGSHLVPALEETEEVKSNFKELKISAEVIKESTEEPSVSQVKESPARRRAKLQVKPILSKRACTKTEGKNSTADQPQLSRFTSPTRQRGLAAREKEESDNKSEPSIKEVSNTASLEADSKSTDSSLITGGPQSPRSQDAWPRVVLPRVKLPQTTEAGVCSASSTPTSSPARVSESASPPVTPLQLRKSPARSCSPTADENPHDDPSRVSQFFLCDIFTEVKEAE